MSSRIASIHCTAALAIGALTFASSAQAAMAPLAGFAPQIEMAAGGCGPGSHRLLTGGCSIRPFNKTQAEYLHDLRPCQPGTHSMSFPNLQGYRCVLDR
jgi:Spy/CpxP family protein refolding chaperone